MIVRHLTVLSDGGWAGELMKAAWGRLLPLTHTSFSSCDSVYIHCLLILSYFLIRILGISTFDRCQLKTLICFGIHSDTYHLNNKFFFLNFFSRHPKFSRNISFLKSCVKNKIEKNKLRDSLIE